MEDIERQLKNIVDNRKFNINCVKLYFRQFQGSDKFLSIIYSVERQTRLSVRSATELEEL